MCNTEAMRELGFTPLFLQKLRRRDERTMLLEEGFHKMAHSFKSRRTLFKDPIIAITPDGPQCSNENGDTIAVGTILLPEIEKSCKNPFFKGNVGRCL